MRTLSLILSIFISFALFSKTHFVITDYDKNTNLRSQMNLHQTYLKLGLFKKLISSEDLGSAISPFFEGSTPYRFYQKGLSTCYKLELRKNHNFVQKISCPHQIKMALKRNNKVYKRVQNLNHFKATTFEVLNYQSNINYINQTYYPSLHHNTPDIGLVDFRYQHKINFNFNQWKAKIESISSVTLDAYSYYSAHTSEVKQELEYKFNSNFDFVFQNGDELLFYKRYQAGVFQIAPLWINPNYLNYLNNIEDILSSGGYCHIDNLERPGPYDCRKIITRNKNFAYYERNSSLIILNFKTLTASIE